MAANITAGRGREIEEISFSVPFFTAAACRTHGDFLFIFGGGEPKLRLFLLFSLRGRDHYFLSKFKWKEVQKPVRGGGGHNTNLDFLS